LQNLRGLAKEVIEMFRKIMFFLMMVSLIFILGCEQDADDSDNAVVSGKVLHSVHNPVGIQDVLVMVEGTSTYNFNKQVKTDKNGRWSISVFLGSVPISSGGEEGGGGIIKHSYIYQLDVDVTFFYPDYSAQIGGVTGLTLTAGEEFDMGEIYIY
jgi:hypothetical protein